MADWDWSTIGKAFTGFADGLSSSLTAVNQSRLTGAQIDFYRAQASALGNASNAPGFVSTPPAVAAPPAVVAQPTTGNPAPGSTVSGDDLATLAANDQAIAAQLVNVAQRVEQQRATITDRAAVAHYTGADQAGNSTLMLAALGGVLVLLLIRG